MRVERFFTIRSDNKFYRAYSDYLENRKVINEKIKEFFKMTGIEANGYYCSTHLLQIIPTKADSKKFADQLCKKAKNADGLRCFKKRSEINLAWVAFIADTKIINQPYLFFFFDGLHGPCRLFFDSDTLYCSGDLDDGAPVPDGLTEIKGSEFWAVIEEMETRDAAV